MKIREIDTSSESETILAIASAYQQAFGHAPWNEGYMCPTCKSKYSLSYKTTHCSQCDSTNELVEYWPTDRILGDFYTEMRNPGSMCVVAERETEVVGFAWGYDLTMCEEASSKLCSPNLHTLVSGNVFYLDEIAVVPKYQGKGIGKKLMSAITPTQGKITLLRTLAESPMQHLASSLGLCEIMSISEERVIMGIGL